MSSYQLCQRCGKPLGPNEVQCSNCRFMNVPPQAAPSPSGFPWVNPASQPPSPSGQLPPGQQWGQPPAQPAPASPPRSQFAPQLSFGSVNPLFGAPSPSAPTIQGAPQPPFTSASPSQPLSGPPSFGGFQQVAPPLSQPLQQQSPTTGWPIGAVNMGGFQQQGFSQPLPNGFQQSTFNSLPTAQYGAPSGTLNASYEQEEADSGRQPKTGLIIGIIALIVVVLAASLGGGFLYLRSRTPVVQVTPTATPLPAPTGKPLFSDTFANNNNGWDLTSKAGQFSVKVGNGSMTLEDDNNRLLWELIPNNQNFSDFFLTVDANLTKGSQANGYGIYIRGTSDQNLDIATYYRFEIYGDGSYAIFKGKVDASGVSNSQQLVNYTPTTIINKAGKVNHIAISAKGSTMAFYVNGQKLKTIIDDTYASGSVALFVSNLLQSPAGAAATFSNLMIYPPQPWA
ncbi:MAG TPA: family 16 glycoside hydrolase [Ktedonobacteraceae bacterium]|nr:family 16 glycoside hydrolase [Ktedonobacteraceae bacterium]